LELSSSEMAAGLYGHAVEITVLVDGLKY